ncbi:diphthine--ammonia ligase [Candidatus Woesearchaeota archaeon]|nr:diphthine--ammonia ligase [Candidatus Woesearchaeota archaeon]
MKLASLFSGGKDSNYSLYLMQKEKHEISCLVIMISENPDSYMFHTPAIELTRLQAQALGIPILEYVTKGEKEEELEDLRKALEQAKKRYGVEGVVTGALYSEYQRSRIQKICDEFGLKTFNPLWHKNQLAYMQELVSAGFEIVFTGVAAYGLDKSWLNKKIGVKEIKRLGELEEKFDINVAGEGGEFESLVLSGPNYDEKLVIEEAEILEEDENTARLIIKYAKLENK